MDTNPTRNQINARISNNNRNPTNVLTADEIRIIERDRQRLRRAQESTADRAARLAANRQLRAERRQEETPEERASRLALLRERRARSRSIEPPEMALQRQSADLQRLIQRNLSISSPLHLAGFNYSPNIDYSTHVLISIGHLDKICRFCQARCFRGEADGLCCAKGKVRLQPIVQPPEPILTLFSGSYPESKQFLKNIRRYNSCFQMTSFGVSGGVVQDGYMPTFRVQGQIYHKIGSILPLPNAQPKFLQIYFMGDESLQLDLRCNLFQGVQRGIVANLQELFSLHNNLIRSFKTALDRMPSDEHRIVIRADRTPVGEHARRFNAPTEDEVAIVLVDSDCSRRDIVIQRRDQRLQRIDETHPSYDALQYPLIFWRGEDTYHFNLRQVDPATGIPTGKKVSAMDYYAHQLMIREDSHNFVLKCCSLLSQYVVDMYAKIETERLLFIRLNQRKLRVDEYIHLRDAVANDADPSNIGQQFILPSTFTGSPRHMHEYAQDAMAYVRLHGRPDLFITFTCNPTWPEITSLLMPNQYASDRHDLVARVFRQKLLKLMGTITKHKLFGPTRCYMYSIEWQFACLMPTF